MDQDKVKILRVKIPIDKTSQHNPSMQNQPIIMSFREGKWQIPLNKISHIKIFKTKSAALYSGRRKPVES